MKFEAQPEDFLLNTFLRSLVDIYFAESEKSKKLRYTLEIVLKYLFILNSR